MYGLGRTFNCVLRPKMYNIIVVPETFYGLRDSGNKFNIPEHA